MLRVTDSVSSAMKYTAIFLYDHFSIYSIIMQPLSAWFKNSESTWISPTYNSTSQTPLCLKLIGCLKH